ncbi:sugar porter family MFS transporter [Plantactinospora mayteni]|uniref:Sugar-transport integral membrane protein n=1 Tax=Plantactinospora mayteni TaxID=566021 RepID=A0ABQ4F2Z1_9ACTN|nr:MFS transporter [Plantactinospora mayteni]GIH01281.1 putative sugar-transport integral membrane protein [Plantactinospora mayteni]
MSEARPAATVARTTAVAVATGLNYGYFGAAMAGAQLFLTPRLGLDTTAQGSLFAVPIVGMILGTVLAGRLVAALGRKHTLLWMAVGATLFSAASPLVAELPWLNVTRFLLGLVMGVTSVVVPIFVAESAPTARRGRIAVLHQVAIMGGIVGAFLVAYLLADSGQWRIMLGLSAVFGVLVVVLLVPAPETPHGLALRADRATRPLGRSGGQTGALRELFGPRYRPVTLFVIVLGTLVQLTGIGAVGNFSPRIFEGMGFRGPFALLVLPAAVQLAGLVASLCSAVAVDRLGRRATLLTGTAVMALGHGLLVAAFALESVDGWGTGLGFVGLLLFTLGFNAGLGSLVWVYASEGYSDHLRGAGATALLLPNLTANFLLAQFFLGALVGFGGVATFGALLVITLLTWIFLYLRAPETKDRSLAEIHAYWQNARRWPDRVA